MARQLPKQWHVPSILFTAHHSANTLINSATRKRALQARGAPGPAPSGGAAHTTHRVGSWAGKERGGASADDDDDEEAAEEGGRRARGTLPPPVAGGVAAGGVAAGGERASAFAEGRRRAASSPYAAVARLTMPSAGVASMGGDGGETREGDGRPKRRLVRSATTIGGGGESGGGEGGGGESGGGGAGGAGPIGKRGRLLRGLSSLMGARQEEEARPRSATQPQPEVQPEVPYQSAVAPAAAADDAHDDAASMPAAGMAIGSIGREGRLSGSVVSGRI